MSCWIQEEITKCELSLDYTHNGAYIFFSSCGYTADYRRILRQLNAYVDGEGLEPPTR
jgi:hypothetical protein